MDTERISGRTITVAVVVFLCLAGVHLWWQHDESGRSGDGDQMVIGNTRLSGGDRQFSLGAEDEPDAGVRRKEARKWLQILASNASTKKRRSAALHLEYLTDHLTGQDAQKALLKHLKSDDRVIARRCGELLLDVWQQSESPSMQRLMEQGLTAFENGQYDRAMNRFEMCLELQPQVSDLHRLRAEIYLARGQTEKALEAAGRATTIQPKNYRAYYLAARCHLQEDEGDEALRQVRQALNIYPSYKPARQLKEKIISLQKAGEL